MKKLKKNIVETKQQKLNLFKPEIKSSRLTIDSRVCNIDKFNEFFALIDNTKNYKNTISQYCYDNLLSLISDYSSFLINYKSLDNSQLNSWERQTIFQEIAGHYSETTTRYLNKAKFIVIKPKSNINNIALFIHNQSNLTVNDNVYALDFNIEDKLIQLTNYLDKYNLELNHNKNLLDNEDKTKKDKTKDIENINKEISKLERLIKSYNKLINPAYTSQECNLCHYISRTNRTKQEEFSCRNPACANHKVKINADSNAAKVIKSRLLNKNLRNKIGKDNVYQCSRTKTINYKLVKSIVEDEYKIGVVTELLPNLHSRLKSKKNYTIFNWI